ncbi:MAG: UDP-N-acetylmuramoyl-tripeptide--D-alanyl-D-alanine ligase [bacterium]|nr:UDP-N-acetylmuramoyl-tripeptide--D-alanyl-D-alanine ligase [bacterium]
MYIVYLSIFTLWPLSALADYLAFCHIWQLKEYRLDRLRDYGKSLTGKQFFRGWRLLSRPLVYLALFLLLPINLVILDFILLAIFLADLTNNLRAIISHRFYRPKLTAKSALLTSLAAAVEGILFYAFWDSPLILLLLAGRWFIFSGLVLSASIPTRLAKNFYVKKAAGKLAAAENLTVIGVTGSYGKTTVKNFLEQILSARFNVIKTPKNINTEIGIAGFILKSDFSGADIFIVEMAAYKIGEIKLICDMVKPRVGILTAINEQHLPLFGSLKNTQTAKYELLRSLPAAGLAIANSDNEYVRQYLGELKCQVKTFGQRPDFKPDLLLSEVVAAPNLKFRANSDEINTNIIGAHNAMNVAPAMLASEYLGLSRQQIAGQCLKLKLPEATMQLVNYGESTIINDSYNSNPEAFAAALNFIAGRETKGKKIVITPGMIELGEASDSAHEKISKLVAETADELIIISPNYAEALKSGLGDSAVYVRSIYEPEKLLNHIKRLKNQPNIILLEGRLPEIVKNEIKK